MRPLCRTSVRIASKRGLVPVLAALFASGCDSPSKTPPAPPEPTPTSASVPTPAFVGETVVLDDLSITVDEVKECTARAYERTAVERANAVLLGVKVSIARAPATTAPPPPARYEGAPRMLLRDGQGREYRYTLRGKCFPELRGANLSAGDTLSGWAAFQVPVTAKNLVLEYPSDIPLAGDSREATSGAGNQEAPASPGPAAPAVRHFVLGR